MAHSTCGCTRGWQVKLRDPSLTRAIPEHLRDEQLIIKCYTNTFGRPFVKRFTLCYRTVVLSVLSVTLVYCGQTVGWIKMPLGTQIGLSPGDIVLDGDPAASRKREQEPPIFGPCLLWPNGWIDQDATWYGDRPRLSQHCVRLGPSPPPRKKGAQQPPLFGPSAFVPKCVCHLCIKELLTYLLSVAKRSPISATAELLLRNR